MKAYVYGANSPEITDVAKPPRLRTKRFQTSIGILFSRILAPATAYGCDNENFLKSSVTCCASPAAAASARWKSRPLMRSAYTAAMRSGRMSHSGFWTRRASDAPDVAGHIAVPLEIAGVKKLRWIHA